LSTDEGPNFHQMIEHINCFGYWIRTHIVNEDNVDNRAKFVSLLINVANECIEINNFNTAFTIFAALNAHSIGRLKLTWEKIPKKTMKNWKNIEELFESRGNYSNYRSRLEKAKVPIVPCIEMISKYLYSVEECNNNYTDENLINIEKMRLLYKGMNEILKYQQGKENYNIVLNEEIFNLFRQLQYIDEEEIDRLSHEIEPNLN